MPSKLNKKDVKKYYEFFDQKETELRAIKPGDGVKETTHVSNFKYFRDFCEKWNRKANIYAGIHERKKGGTKKEDVISIKIIPIDIDSKHPKDQAATQSELEEAEACALTITQDFQNRSFKKPMMVMTGNGYQLLFQIPKIVITDENRDKIEEKLQEFIRKKFIIYQEHYNVKIDQIGDLPRVIKVPGTMSVKGDNTKRRPRRRAKIVDVGEGVDQKLRDELLITEVSKEHESVHEEIEKVALKDFKQFCEKDEKLKRLYNDELTQEYPSRSEAEMALVCMLVFYNFTNNQIKQLMSECKISKWQEKIRNGEEQYCELTIRKARELVKERYATSDFHDIHPAGDFLKEYGLVYEPINKREYAWKWGDKKGVSKLKAAKDKEGKVIRWFFQARNRRLWLKKKIPRFLFPLPNVGIVKKWANGKHKSKDTKNIWRVTKNYFKLFLDLSGEMHDILTLETFQTWLIEIINSVFFSEIIGAIGAGKTATLEAFSLIAKHGHMSSNLSEAFACRVCEKQKATLIIDEVDEISRKKEGKWIWAFMRQGQRKGQLYSRVKKEKPSEFEFYDIFGPRVYSVHGEADEAVETRSMPVHITETQSKDLPILNIEKSKLAEDLHTELFLWMMDNLDKVDLVDIVDLRGRQQRKKKDKKNEVVEEPVSPISVNQLNHINPDIAGKRKELVNELKSKITKQQIEILNNLSGRDIELAYLMFLLSNVLGVDVNESIKKSFEMKSEMRSERTDVGQKAIMKDTLKKLYEEHVGNENYRTSSGLLKISNKESYKKFNDALKKQEGEGVSPATFKKYLHEFGFSRPCSRKKLKIPIDGKETVSSRLCNIFTSAVLSKLGIKQRKLSESTEEEVNKENKENFATGSNIDNVIQSIDGEIDEYKLIELIMKKKNLLREEAYDLLFAWSKKGLVMEVKPGLWTLSNE